MDAEAQAQFVAELTAAQPRLFGYLMTLLGNEHDASNVLQEANLLLWTKAEEFRRGTNFFAWARDVAYYKALSYVRDVKRDRLIVDHRLVDQVLDRQPAYQDHERRMALRHCLSLLDDRQQRLLRSRYAEGASIAAVAADQQKSESAVKMALRRIRMSLLACMKRRLAANS
jgi:RNA polymerase sigma-70 factor (ECF subfamily)